MVYLLDDSDIEVVGQIEEKLLDMGTAILPILEDQWHRENLTDMHHKKIFEILHKIKSKTILEEIKEWKVSQNQSALYGAFLIAKAIHPTLEYKTIEAFIEEVRMDVWLQIQPHLSAWERVRILNDVLFTKFGFAGDRENYHGVDNSLIHKVISNKKGNPISLSIIYFSVAQRLNLPIFGVNLPQHFVLAFMPSDFDESTGDFSEKYKLNKEDFIGEPLFYIDAFSEGLPFDKTRLEEFLKEVKIKPQEQFYYPCTNIAILQRVVRNLLYSLEQQKDDKKFELLAEIKEILDH